MGTVAASKCARQRVITALRCAVERWPAWSNRVDIHMSGTRNFAVTTADLPSGPVKTQIARPGVPDQSDHERHRPVLGQGDFPEEALEPPKGRCNQRATRALWCQMRQVHRPGPDHPRQDHAQRLEARLAQADMRASRLLEIGARANVEVGFPLARRSPPRSLPPASFSHPKKPVS